MRRPALLAGLLLLAGTASAAADPAADEIAIRDRLETWRQDFNAGRADKVCDLFAPDLIAGFQGRGDLDHAGLCALLQSSLAMTDRRFHYELQIQDVLVSGDLAAVRLIWTLDLAIGGQTERSRDQGLDVFQRQSDGVWRIARFIGYLLPAE